MRPPTHVIWSDCPSRRKTVLRLSPGTLDGIPARHLDHVADDMLHDDLADIIRLLDHVRLDRPVVLAGTMRCADHSRPVRTVLDYTTLGDVLALDPWPDMDIRRWTVDAHGDLRYEGRAGHASATCTWRSVRPGRVPDPHTDMRRLLRATTPLGPLALRTLRP